MIKRLLAIFSTAIIIMGIIFPIIVNAENGIGEPYGVHENMNDTSNVSQEDFISATENGSVKYGNGEAPIDISGDSMNSLIKNSVKIFNILPSFARVVLTIMTNDTDSTYVDTEKYGEGFSIQKTVFGKIRLFDVNFLKRDDDEDAIQKMSKDIIAELYFILRNISIALMLLVLIYTGLRLALSTLASSAAKYKTMLKNWLVSIIILFTLQYFMVLIIELGNIASNLCETILTDMVQDDDEYRIEERLLDQASTSSKKGWSIVIPTILYWLLTYYQIKFFMIYMRRLFTMAFLVTIAPLITVSYSIDKAGGR